MASIGKVRELFETARFMPLLTEMANVRIATEESALAKKGDQGGMMLAEVKRRLESMFIEQALVLVQRHLQERLSDDELDWLITFYRSPLYEKFVSLMPDLWMIVQSSSELIEANAEIVAKQVAEEFRSGQRSPTVQ